MTKREVAQVESKRDVEKSRRQLLTDINDESLDRDRSGDETISRVLARFAALLVVLSEQADKTTQINLKMQNRITCLTWVLCGLTAALVIFAIVQIVIMLK